MREKTFYNHRFKNNIDPNSDKKPLVLDIDFSKTGYTFEQLSPIIEDVMMMMNIKKLRIYEKE